MPTFKPFHGSYRANDVTFLLKQLDDVEDLPPLEKERMIQSGQRHYSEMLKRESLPSDAYMTLFMQAMDNHASHMAKDAVALAQCIYAAIDAPILVSLVRAGTPVGVVLKHLLTDLSGQDVAHYSVSIIRDRGIDNNAIKHILNHHKSDGSNLVFVDGWTGKGVINHELTKAVHAFNQTHATNLLPNLYVLSDLAGVAWQSASFDDYLIPSAILNATVSGLVSRSVLNKQIARDDFHGCVYYDAFLEQDYSRHFVDRLLALAKDHTCDTTTVPNAQKKQQQKDKMASFIADISSEFGITDINLIKPGIGESTRVLLRRVPELLIVRDTSDADVEHLVVLAHEKNVPMQQRPSLPFKALSLIKRQQ